MPHHWFRSFGGKQVQEASRLEEYSLFNLTNDRTTKLSPVKHEGTMWFMHLRFEVKTQKQSKTYSLHGWNHVTSILYLLSKNMFVWMIMWPDLSGLTQWWNLQIHRSIWIRGPSLWQWTHDEFLFHWKWLKKHTHALSSHSRPTYSIVTFQSNLVREAEMAGLVWWL